MKLKVTKSLIEDILSWIEEGATKDSKGNSEIPTILSRLKEYSLETTGAQFKQSMMIPLFNLNISAISDYKTLEDAYRKRQSKEIEGFEIDFDTELAEWHKSQVENEDDWDEELQNEADARIAEENYLLD